MKRSEPVPLERGHHMSGFLPRAPLAWTLGAEELSYIFYVYLRGADGLKRGFDNISRGKEIARTHSLPTYL